MRFSSGGGNCQKRCGVPHDIQVAALIHGAVWASAKDHFEVGPGVSLCRMSETAVGILYQSLCGERGIDEGEPFDYEAFFLLKPTVEDPHLLDVGDPYSLADRLSNIFTIITGKPVGMCRVIWSSDNFRSAAGTDRVYVLIRQSEFIEGDSAAKISDSSAGELATAWNISQALWEKEKARGRMANALVFYYYAWRSSYIEQICLNLAITLEVLFAPHSESETTHQLAFNVSRFLASDLEGRERIYQMIRKFYRIRSAIVHGGIRDDNRIIDITVGVFRVTTGILKKILLNERLAQTFHEEPKRKELLRQYLFL
jgi:hypothetical protein